MAARFSVLARVFLVLAVLIALIFVARSWLRPTALVAEVRRGKALDARPGAVIVEAEYWMDIKSDAGGRIVSSELEPGRAFARDEPMLQVDTRDIDLEIERAENELETRRKQVDLHTRLTNEIEVARQREALENYERLFKLGQYPELELVQRRRDFRSFEYELERRQIEQDATFAGMELALKGRRLQRDRMTVRAPFDGVVSQVYARPGDLIGGGTPIARLISTGRTVEARISEENFAGIAVGNKASVRFLGFGSQLYGASVTKILPTADPDTQRYVVYLSVDVPPERLVPGTTGEVSIVAGERDHALIIPRRALFGTNVFVVENNIVRLRSVQIGFTALTAVEILGGVAEGELVIVDQLENFREGDRVHLARETKK